MPILEPTQTWSIIPAQQLAGVADQKVLMVGQILATGTATAGDLIQDLPNDGTEDTLFGQRSHLAGMVREFKALNEITQLDLIPLDDAGGATPGTAVITLAAGPATADSSFDVIVGSYENHRYTIDALTADTITDIGDAIAAAITADADAPFTAANAAGTVTITAANGGTLCNDWTIAIEGSMPAGVTYTLTGWAGGATDPTLTSILDVIGDTRYQTIVWPSAYDLSEVQTLLDARFNASYQILDGMAIQVKKGTLAGLKSYANQNSQSIWLVGNKTLSESDRIGTAIYEMPDIIAVKIAAFKALKLSEGAPLARYLSTVAANDQYGGIALASLPYHNTLIPGLHVADSRDEFTLAEQNELRDSGVSLIGPNRSFNASIMGTQVTTYLTNPAGNPDTSFLYVNTVETMSVIREFMYENFRSRYAQTRLTDGDLIAGRDMANEASIRAFLSRLYDSLADEALVQLGTAAKKDFVDNTVVTVSVSTGTVTVNIAPLIVTQLRVVLGTIQVKFSS